MGDNVFPNITFEEGIPIPESKPKNTMIHYFYESIGEMRVGDSFLVTGKYSIGDNAMQAFRMRGWKGAKRQVEKTKDYVNWTFRIWRIK